MLLDEVISWIFTIVAACIILVIFPLIIFFGRMDQSVQANVNAYHVQFVDNVKVNGKITKENFDKFLKELDSTGYAYNIEMIHESNLVVPILNSDGTFSGKIKDSKLSYTKDEILEELYDASGDGVYEMKLGDNITIDIISRKETISNRLFRALLQINSSLVNIHSNYGGSILNNPQ